MLATLTPFLQPVLTTSFCSGVLPLPVFVLTAKCYYGNLLHPSLWCDNPSKHPEVCVCLCMMLLYLWNLQISEQQVCVLRCWDDDDNQCCSPWRAVLEPFHTKTQWAKASFPFWLHLHVKLKTSDWLQKKGTSLFDISLRIKELDCCKHNSTTETMRKVLKVGRCFYVFLFLLLWSYSSLPSPQWP